VGNLVGIKGAMSDQPKTIVLASPAKVNLMLSVHGPRADGFHALTSVVAALNFGDRLTVGMLEGTEDHLHCTDPDVPLGAGNLIIKAAALFRETLGRQVFFEFNLEKHIPMGAGLGGGSSNASTALLGMNTLLGHPFSKERLRELSAQLGSDCPFFIDPRPSVMRGRGELIELLPDSLANVLRGQRLALFRPNFAVETAWAYQQMRAHTPGSYEAEGAAATRLNRFEETQDIGGLLFNSFQSIVGKKYLAVPTLLDQLAREGVDSLMSGSGSCCFSILKEGGLSSLQVYEICRDAWGEGVFWVETLIA
jgi:4-diphosphocytidyl-2-C-methyl-D-erythritol kinase